MKNQFTKLVMIIALAVGLALLASCGDDSCPSCPTDQESPVYKGWVYFTSSWDQASIYQIDTETGDAVDSVLPDPEYHSAGSIAASPDGHYLAASHCCVDEYDSLGHLVDIHTITRIYDAQTLAPLVTIPRAMDPVFPSNQPIMVGFSHDSVDIYDIPSFERTHVDFIENVFSPVLFERDTLIYATHLYGTDRIDSVDIIAYNYVRREITRKWKTFTDDGLFFAPNVLAIHPDGRRMYILGGDPHTLFCALYCYDLVSESVIFSFPMYGSNGDVAVSPDGKEVYATDPGGVLQEFPVLGTIFILDADNGMYIDGISLFGYGRWPGEALAGGHIVFTPTGERAFVGVGLPTKSLGTVLTIDTKERRIIHLAWSEIGHDPQFLAIAPKL